MASSAFDAIVAGLNLSKNMDSIIVNTDYLGEGIHEVFIQAVDTTKMNEDQLLVSYATADGKSFRETIFTLSKNKTEFGFSLRSLWSATLQEKDALAKLLELMKDNKALEILTGMKLKITLEYGKGIQARSNGAGGFAGYDKESNAKMTGDFVNIKDVYEDLNARALKKSYLQVKKYEKTDKDSNLKAFWFAVNVKEQASVPKPGTIVVNL